MKVDGSGTAEISGMVRINVPPPNDHRILKNKGKASIKQSLTPLRIHETIKTDPDLAKVASVWNDVDPAIRSGIVAMILAAATRGVGQ